MCLRRIVQDGKTAEMEIEFDVTVRAFNDNKMRCHFTAVDTRDKRRYK